MTNFWCPWQKENNDPKELIEFVLSKNGYRYINAVPDYAQTVYLLTKDYDKALKLKAKLKFNNMFNNKINNL